MSEGIAAPAPAAAAARAALTANEAAQGQGFTALFEQAILDPASGAWPPTPLAPAPAQAASGTEEDRAKAEADPALLLALAGALPAVAGATATAETAGEAAGSENDTAAQDIVPALAATARAPALQPAAPLGLLPSTQAAGKPPEEPNAQGLHSSAASHAAVRSPRPHSPAATAQVGPPQVEAERSAASSLAAQAPMHVQASPLETEPTATATARGAAQAPLSAAAYGASAPLLAPARAAPVARSEAIALRAPDFAEAFAERAAISIRLGASSATLAIEPPQLGPVELAVSVREGEARVHFAAEHPAVREAIAEALPRLRELLAAQGLALAEASVGSELPRREESRHPGPAAAMPPHAAASEPVERPRLPSAEDRLVDTFA